MRRFCYSLIALFALALPAAAQNVCGSQGACVQQSPTRPDAATQVQLNNSTGTVGAVNTANNATVVVPGGLFAYVTAIYIDVCGDGTGTAQNNVNFTSTGLSGAPSWSYSATTTNSANSCFRLGDSFATPLKSSAPGTNVVITTPAAALHTGYTVRVYYYLAP